MPALVFVLLSAAAATPGAPLSYSAQAETVTETEVDFAREVRPLLARRCFACHGNDEETREAGLRLDVEREATRDRDGFRAIAPGSLEDSEVWVRITDDLDPMPPEHASAPLDAAERDLIRRWIESGAEYAEHWAFVPPEKAALPERARDEEHPIDAWIRDALAERGLDLSQPADDYTLLRRVSLDLTGLPPTPEEARAFAGSDDPAKFEAAVERLLASPAYAERWAAVWLDLARYADSSGHGSDPLRTIWRYRDWVIEAFDQNMPFDEFTVQQLAGDLLPDATVDTKLATAFHRNTMTNTEGGTDDEEFRVLAVKDRVNTTLQVWMGLTAGCAECHSHKYDPISHTEYYQLFDIFNQTADADRNNDAPRLETPTREQRAEHERLSAAIADVDADLAALPALSPVEQRAVEAELIERIRPFAWDAARVVSIEGAGEEAPTVLENGGFLFANGGPTARRLARIAEGPGAPTALRLDACAHPSLPHGGPGHNGASGNFVLTDLQVRALDPDPRPRRARSVRVELPGAGRILSLAEVEVFDAAGVRATGVRAASQSSTAYAGPAHLAVDGNTSGAFDDGSVTHTATEEDPWWSVEYEADVEVAAVRVWSRTDGRLEERLHGFRVVLLDADGAEVWRSAPARAPLESVDVGPVAGEPLLLTASSASHEQPGFAASLAVDAFLNDRDGWAIGGAEGTSQSAVFALPPLDGPRRLDVTMCHDWGGDHVLGCFQLAVADSAVADAAGADAGGADAGGAAGVPLAVPLASELALYAPIEARTDAQARFVDELLARHDPRVAALRARRAELAAQRDALQVVTTPVMVELPPDRRRATHVMVRGNFLQTAEEVHAAVPAAFPPLPDGVEPDRLTLARWLVSDSNPLTARVTVNRVWARLFGRGLVRTEGDFGSQGDTPTHPELLDWLAVEFSEGGWDHKALLRTIVTSRAYRQSSAVRDESLRLDPDAALLSRFPRQRLVAEAVRDVALSASGLLSTKRFGPSVYPPQPEGLWKAAFNGQRSWPTSMGEDRYRRGLYVFLRRTIPYPMLATFDAPSRETCTVQRIPTNTPLQAFVTLNDPVFVEASQALAQRVRGSGDDDEGQGDSAAIERLLWRTLVRPPLPVEVELLTGLLADARSAFAGDPDAAREFAPAGAAAPVEAAAWTLVASTALNLDSFLTKE